MDNDKFATIADVIPPETNAALDQAAHATKNYGRQIVNRAKDYAQQTNRVIHDRSWTALGIAVAVGLLAGFLMHKR